MNNHHCVSKQDIAHSFSQAATTYDSAADLQRQIGHRLITLMPKGNYRHVLDLGCGTGYFAPHLQEALQTEQFIGLDMAEGMVSFAKKHAALTQAEWCCADAESLPLKDASLCLIFSNLALQWCTDLSMVMAEALRVLRPGGYFVFSTLGPDTLNELKKAWKQVDDYVHVNHFLDRQEIISTVNAVGFNVKVTDEYIVTGYHQLRSLTTELKSLGAHNLNPGRRVGLTGKTALQKLRQAYETYRDDQGMLPATYQTYYFILHKNPTHD